MNANEATWRSTDRSDGWTVCLRWEGEPAATIVGVSVLEPSDCNPDALRATDYESMAREVLRHYGVDLEAWDIDTDDGSIHVGEGGETIYLLRRVASVRS